MTISVMGVIVMCEAEECENGFHITVSNMDAFTGHGIDLHTVDGTIRAGTSWHMRGGHDFCSQECLGKYEANDPIDEHYRIRDASMYPIVHFAPSKENKDVALPPTEQTDYQTSKE